MWSLFKRKKDSCSSSSRDVGRANVGEGIFDYSAREVSSEDGEELSPMKFSNGKTQADVVSEVLKAIEEGEKIIFIKGVCGSGKSAMALNLARHFKKTSIVVPIKSLQKQYEVDYTKEKFILKKDNQPLKISVIKGRNNFSCPFLGGRADESELPCCIDIREKNIDMIKSYIDKNPFVEKFDFSNISDVRRMSIAPACPYWSPLLPTEIKSRVMEKAKKIKYKSISGKEYALFQRQKGCGYCDQYTAYSDADVLIFNSMKYKLEVAMGRKPRTDIEIIDECDEFLDDFAVEKKINLNRLLSALSNLVLEKREDRQKVKEMIHEVNMLIMDPSIKVGENVEDVRKLKDTNFLDLFEKILASPYLAEDMESNYYNSVFESLMEFRHLKDETYLSMEKVSSDEQKGLFGARRGFNSKEDTIYVNLVSINLAQKFKDIVDRNNVLVLMSGTLHSEKVLKDIFGLDNFKIVEAETEMPGTVNKFRTGLEKNCKYENFRNGSVTREDYLKALEACVRNADKPLLVHVFSFMDLPSEREKEMYNLTETISRERILDLQRMSNNQLIEDFKSRESDVLFTTKCSRGVDFAGDLCKSIILTKFPYPNIQGLFWKILRKEQPNKFMEFYMDKARRELIQKVARGVRFKGDHVLLLSPDSRVLDARVS